MRKLPREGFYVIYFLVAPYKNIQEKRDKLRKEFVGIIRKTFGSVPVSGTEFLKPLEFPE